MNIDDLACFDYIFEPIVAIDDKGHLIYFNYYFPSFSRYSPRILKKYDKITNLISKSSINIPGFFKKAMKSKEVTTSEEIKIDFEGPIASYEVVIKIIPIKLENKNHFLVCFRDLSIEKKLHNKYRKQLDMLKKNHSQIVQADKITSMGELIAGITNDLNNPLAVASGNCEVMDMHFSKDNINDTKNSLMKCNRELQISLEKINEIILNMKNFLGKDGNKKEYCDLKDIIDNAVKIMSPSFKKTGIIIKKEIKDKNTTSFILREKIEQIIVNLLANALHAMQDKKQKKGEIKINLYQKDHEYAIIDVDDNGPGIPQKSQNEIFNSFFSTNKDENPGLGLAISSKIIDAHHGSLTLEPKKGKGALFRIKLPIMELGSFLQHQNLENSLDPTKQAKGGRILILDSEVKILNTLSKLLEEDGHAPIGSVDAANALKILNSIEVDMIVTGYNMPKMNGPVFVQKVREMNIQCPILYLTSKEYQNQCKKEKDKHQITDFILKPFNRSDILKKIKSTLNV